MNQSLAEGRRPPILGDGLRIPEPSGLYAGQRSVKVGAVRREPFSSDIILNRLSSFAGTPTLPQKEVQCIGVPALTFSVAVQKQQHRSSRYRICFPEGCLRGSKGRRVGRLHHRQAIQGSLQVLWLRFFGI